MVLVLPSEKGDDMTLCPKCSECLDSDHHWVEEIDEATGEPILVCKHCDATKPWEDEDWESDT